MGSGDGERERERESNRESASVCERERVPVVVVEVVEVVEGGRRGISGPGLSRDNYGSGVILRAVVPKLTV